MIVKETVLAGGKHPGTTMEVLKSGAGYYLGFCDKDGAPYSRESVYFGDAQLAKQVLSYLRTN